MADVRSMLRDERAARRITHPQAQYTPGGLLICKACRVQLKSDALWQPHIASPAHINALKSLASGMMAQPQSKKRKMDDDGDDEEAEGALRKRAKGSESFEKSTDSAAAVTAEDAEQDAVPAATESSVAAPESGAVDEDEWAAFEREVAQSPSAEAPAQEFGDSSGVVISAAPMTAAELAAKSREEQSTQAKERREAEIEGEREDAQRRLDEEFDEMEELEARVRRLKEQREALRQKLPPKTVTVSAGREKSTKPTESDGESDESEDDWDNWGGL